MSTGAQDDPRTDAVRPLGSDEPTPLGTSFDEHDSLAEDGEADEFEQLLRQVARAPSIQELAGPDETLEPDTVVDGSFRIVRVLGRGGMGVVYLADHLRLERPVALKLHSAAQGSTGTTRLLREARTLAELVHDNVITVYDVGTFEQQVYIAMEYVDGGTVRDWLGRGQRSHDEIVQLFIQAGRGLAAAHTAGLIHRDFKPDNLLVGNEGRVRVADFGLARRAEDSQSKASRDALPTVARQVAPSLEGPLTSTGAVVGTPAYMAPEQHRGQPADARSDQFAFCVALYEAVYGTRPFQGDTLLALVSNILEGDPPAVPDERGVSEAVRQVLRRGLAREPADRFESMTALLAALERRPWAGWRGWIAIGVVAAAAGASVWVAQRGEPVADCEAGAARVAEVWGAEQGAALEGALATNGVGPRVRARLDDYAAQWSQAHRDACEARWTTEAQSQRDLDLRMACLSVRRQELAAAVGVLMGGEPQVALQADRVTLSLSAIEPCADVDALRRIEPIAAADREEVDKVERALARAKGLEYAGRYEQASIQAAEALRLARASGYSLLESRALYWVGQSAMSLGREAEASEVSEMAVGQAVAAGDDRLALRHVLELIYLDGYLLERVERADRWLRQADALMERIEDVEQAQIKAWLYEGLTRRRQGKYTEALASIERAHTAMQTLPEDDQGRMTRLSVVAALAVTQARMGSFDVAQRSNDEALALAESLYGPDHPTVATELNHAAAVRLQRGNFVEAEPLLRRALAIRHANFGPGAAGAIEIAINLGNSLREQGRLEEAGELLAGMLVHADSVPPRVGVALRSTLAAIRLGQEDFDEAERLFRAALRLARASWDADSGDVVRVQSNIINLLNQQERWAEAVAEARAALSTIAGSKREGLRPIAAYLQLDLGNALYQQERTQEAKQAYTSAVELMEATLGSTHPHLQGALHGLAQCWYDEGLPAEAEPMLRRALPMLSQIEPRGRGSTRFLMAEVLWARGAKTESRAQATKAVADYAEIASPRSAEIETWLQEHPG